MIIRKNTPCMGGGMPRICRLDGQRRAFSGQKARLRARGHTPT